MAEDSEYELLPHEEVEKLREDVERLKNNPLGKRYGGVDLIDSVHNLTQTINYMNKLFENTNKEMAEEFKSTNLQEQFKSISSQNEQIAKGIVTVAEMVQSQQEFFQSFQEKLEKLIDSINTTQSKIIQQQNVDAGAISPFDSQENTNQLPPAPNELNNPIPTSENKLTSLPEPPQNNNNLSNVSQGNLNNNYLNQNNINNIPPLDLPPPRKKKGFGKLF